MSSSPEKSGGESAPISAGEWSDMGDIEPAYKKSGSETIQSSASEHHTEKNLDELAAKAKQLAKTNGRENADDEGPVIDEKKVAEWNERKGEKEREEKKKELRQEALERVEVDDKDGASANVTERDGTRIESLVQMIRNGEESLANGKSEYVGGRMLSKVFAKFDKSDRSKSVLKHKRELRQRYGIDYDAYTADQLEHQAAVMIRRGETPGYRNWEYAVNFEKVKMITSSKHGKEITKTLKKMGYDSVPSEMGDENFTMYEVGQIARAAEELYLNLSE